MKVAFYNVGELDRPLCVCRMEAVPRQSESVVIDLDGWVVETVTYVIMPNDEPVIKVLLRSPD